ncbi:hypothetical protein D8770_09600 [Methylobacterium sp. DB1607]|nr:hypothetical protein [Methylobacterium sp. DB1607]
MRPAGEGGPQPVLLQQAALQGARRGLPWLVLAMGLGLATMPAWRVLAFGVQASVEDLLQIRCLPW